MAITDNDGRTALHYAATINDNGHFYNVLSQLGSNPKALDKVSSPTTLNFGIIYKPNHYVGNIQTRNFRRVSFPVTSLYVGSINIESIISVYT